jgi:arsenate reductase-like glutaredoxin family protein
MIQIFGTKKCKDTAKAQRFFKERGVKTQFIDLSEKAMSRGELAAVSRSVPLDELIDTSSKEYEKRNLKYIKHDIEEELIAAPVLFKTPVVRCGKEAAAGYAPDAWKRWADSEKGN